MPATCSCPSCRRRLQVPDHLLGATVQCPQCSSTFVATAETHSEAVTATPPVPSPRPEPAPPAAEFAVLDPHAPPWERKPTDMPAALSGGRAIAAMILLGAAVVTDILFIGAEGVRLSILGTMTPAGFQAASDELVAADIALGCVGLSQSGIHLATVVLFCLWIYQAHDNLKWFGVSGLEFTPGWAVGWFFVPIANLFRPYQAAQEIWKASDPDVPLTEPYAWRRAGGSARIGLWWASWIVSNLIGISFQMSGAVTLDAARDEAVVAIVASIASAVAAVLALLVIRAIHARQVRKYQLVVDLTERR